MVCARRAKFFLFHVFQFWISIFVENHTFYHTESRSSDDDDAPRHKIDQQFIDTHTHEHVSNCPYRNGSECARQTANSFHTLNTTHVIHHNFNFFFFKLNNTIDRIRSLISIHPYSTNEGDDLIDT